MYSRDNGLVDKIPHCSLLLTHDALPLFLHLFEHFGWLLNTLSQLALFFHFASLHRAHHRLLRLDFADLGVDLLQIISQLRAELFSDLCE